MPIFDGLSSSLKGDVSRLICRPGCQLQGMSFYKTDVPGRRGLNWPRFTLHAGKRSDQLEHGAAKDNDVLWMYCQAATAGDRASIDTHYILRSQIDKMPATWFEYKAGVLTRHSGIHQNDIVIESTSDSRFAARKHVYQTLLGQPAGGIFVLNAGIYTGTGRRSHTHDPQYTVILTYQECGVETRLPSGDGRKRRPPFHE